MDSKPRPVEALDKALRLQGVNRSVEESTGSRWVLRLFGSALCEGYHPNAPFIYIYIYIYVCVLLLEHDDFPWLPSIYVSLLKVLHL